MKHRHLRTPLLAAGALFVATSLALAGCSSSSNSASSSPSNKQFVFGITADPTQMVPWTATSAQSIQVLSQIYTPLLSTSATGQTTAGIAALPKVSSDGLTYTFTLKKGVKFSDGKDLTSADVKYTFEKIIDPASKASSRSYLASVSSIATPASNTVKITLKTPDASFPAGLSNVTTGIVPENSTADALQTKPEGSGPYQFVSHTANESITLKRNDDFYAGKPGAAKLQFRVIADSQAMVSALKTGSVDAAVFDNPVTAKSAINSETSMKTVDSLSYHVLQLRASSQALSNVNSRLAVQCALSRTEVINSAALGAGTPTGPITSPDYRSSVKAQPCATRNLKKARAYLAKAGTPDGFTLNLMTSQGLYSTAVDEAQNVQSQLAKVGIKVNVQTLDSNTYVQKWLAGDFDAAIAMNSGSADPNTMYAKYFTSTGSYNKVAGYSSPKLDSLFAQAVATTNVSKRKSVYKQISAQLSDNAAWVWLFTPKKFVVLNNGVHNFQTRTDADLSQLWKATLS
jgi:peptide/nickel transport system substrate-binding protein